MILMFEIPIHGGMVFLRRQDCTPPVTLTFEP